MARQTSILGCYFLVAATEVPETVQPVFSMEQLAMSGMSEVRSENKFVVGLPSDLENLFEQ